MLEQLYRAQSCQQQLQWCSSASKASKHHFNLSQFFRSTFLPPPKNASSFASLSEVSAPEKKKVKIFKKLNLPPKTQYLSRPALPMLGFHRISLKKPQTVSASADKKKQRRKTSSQYEIYEELYLLINKSFKLLYLYKS